MAIQPDRARQCRERELIELKGTSERMPRQGFDIAAPAKNDTALWTTQQLVTTGQHQIRAVPKTRRDLRPDTAPHWL